MMSCQVSLKPKSGPVISQSTTTPPARANMTGCPAARAVFFAKSENHDDFLLTTSNRRRCHRRSYFPRSFAATGALKSRSDNERRCKLIPESAKNWRSLQDCPHRRCPVNFYGIGTRAMPSRISETVRQSRWMIRAYVATFRLTLCWKVDAVVFVIASRGLDGSIPLTGALLR